MIAYLSGTVREVTSKCVTVLVGGIGFTVQVPTSYSFSEGEDISLEIYSHTTQDQGTTLYGFLAKDERAVFELVIGCSGVGPRMGIAILSKLSPALFVSAVMTGDVKTLNSVDGIGLKKAESIIVQLKDRVTKLNLSNTDSSSYQAATVIKQVSEALSSLGYSRPEINSAVETIRKQGLADGPFDSLLRASLHFLAKKSL